MDGEDMAVDQTTRVGLTLKMANDVDEILKERLGSFSLMEGILYNAIASGAVDSALKRAGAYKISEAVLREIQVNTSLQNELNRMIREEIHTIMREKLDNII